MAIKTLQISIPLGSIGKSVQMHEITVERKGQPYGFPT